MADVHIETKECLTSEIFNESEQLLRKKCDLQQKFTGSNEFLERCEENLQKVRNKRKNYNTDELLQWFTQAVLDFTFCEENILVDHEFSEDQNGKEKLHEILEYLSKPESLINKLYGVGKLASEVLGGELLETIKWRKGALLYMFCCTERDRETISDEDNYEQCLQEGVKFLSQMLEIRNPIKDEWKDVLGNDLETYQLLSSGIFSDTHVLAIMYAGEMCFWYSKDITNPDANFKFKTTGESFLQKYIDLVQGPLKNKGWNIARAVEILEHLRR